jgi:hypothetical protein
MGTFLLEIYRLIRMNRGLEFHGKEVRITE